MKPVRFTTALLIMLAFMSFGCASLSSSAANSPTLEQEQEQPDKNAEPGNNGFWEVLYDLLTVGGQTLANK
jgi:hypothetical protein